MEAPLKAALDVPSVRRYMVFNSALFNFILAPVGSLNSHHYAFTLCFFPLNEHSTGFLLHLRKHWEPEGDRWSKSQTGPKISSPLFPRLNQSSKETCHHPRLSNSVPVTSSNWASLLLMGPLQSVLCFWCLGSYFHPLPSLHQVLYMVVWCAVFSTLHLYITVTDYWVLCLTVSLVSIFLTTAVIFILHHSNKTVSWSVVAEWVHRDIFRLFISTLGVSRGGFFTYEYEVIII